MKKNAEGLLGTLLIVLAALFWGSAFVTQRISVSVIPPVTFNAARSFVGILALLPVIAFSDVKAGRKPFHADPEKSGKKLLLGGIVCGVVLTFACNLQQLGIVTSTAGKSGFITALYIVLVPVLGLVLKKKTSPLIWGSVALALAGMYLLCMKEGFSLAIGDVYLLLCALCYAVQILAVDLVCRSVDGVRLSFIQFSVLGVLSLLIGLIFEHPTFAQLADAWFPVLYTGIFSCGIAYTLQIIGQKYSPPQVASIAMSLESVFAVLSGAIFLKETMSARETVGCILVFCAILFTQIPLPAFLKEGRPEKFQ